MTDREPGFYWVIKEDGYPMEAGHWCGLHWWLTGSERPWNDTDFDEIGPKIEPPNEAGYITVPTDPVPEVYAARIEPPDASP